eukprot:3400358-Rhodomonas_salina.3
MRAKRLGQACDDPVERRRSWSLERLEWRDSRASSRCSCLLSSRRRAVPSESLSCSNSNDCHLSHVHSKPRLLSRGQVPCAAALNTGSTTRQLDGLVPDSEMWSLRACSTLTQTQRRTGRRASTHARRKGCVRDSAQPLDVLVGEIRYGLCLVTVSPRLHIAGT